jgi:hypothetical protein
MPHDLRIIRPAMTPAALDTSPPLHGIQQIDPDRPLLHPCFKSTFPWAHHTATIHAQRKEAGSLEADANWFYLELPDGTFHEVQASRLRHILRRAHGCATSTSLADAFRYERVKTLHRLRQIARHAGLER